MGKILFFNRVPPAERDLDAYFRQRRKDLVIFTEKEKRPLFERAGYETLSVDDYHDDAAVIAEIATKIPSGSLEHVFATSETDVLRAARVREQFGVAAGQRLASAVRYRDKFVMKSALRGARSFGVPRNLAMEPGARYEEIAEILGPVFVVKPRVGMASEGVSLVRSAAEFPAVVSPEAAMAEEFVDGGMIHVDGAVIKGRLRLLSASSYVNGCLAYREGKMLGSFMLDSQDALFLKARAAIEEVIAALPSPENFVFHAEFFVERSGRLVFCEIASRVGGAFVSESMEEAFGIDAIALPIHAELKLPLPAKLRAGLMTPKSRFGWVVCPPQETGAHSLAESASGASWIVRKEIASLEDGRRAKNSVDSIGTFLIRLDSDRDFIDKMAVIGGWLGR
jgi:hypothetical protein